MYQSVLKNYCYKPTGEYYMLYFNTGHTQKCYDSHKHITNKWAISLLSVQEHGWCGPFRCPDRVLHNFTQNQEVVPDFFLSFCGHRNCKRLHSAQRNCQVQGRKAHVSEGLQGKPGSAAPGSWAWRNYPPSTATTCTYNTCSTTYAVILRCGWHTGTAAVCPL